MDRKASHNGVEFTEEELKDFQRVFPTTKAAALLGRVIDRIAENWRGRLTDLSSGPDVLRQSQGALDALGSLVGEGVALAALEIDWEAEVEGESESDDTGGDIDVGY